MTRPKILSVFNRYLQYGGEETMAKTMAETLRSIANVHEYNYSTEEWLRKGKLTAPLRGLHNKQVIGELKQLHAEHQFDCWLIHNVFPGMSPSVYSLVQKLQVPVIHILHNYRFGCLNGLLFRNEHECQECPQKGNFLPGIRHKCWNGNYITSLFSAIFQLKARHSGILHYAQFVALSHKQAELLISLGIPKEKLHIIPLFVDTYKEPYTPPPADGHILFIGRLSPEKGLLPVLEAWKDIHTSRQLIIAGDGPQREELENYVSQHHLTNVIFKGFVPKEQQQELWDKTTAYISPSLCHEAGATAILEALGRGRPVIAYAKGAACDHIANPMHGWLMNPDDPNSLKQTLHSILQMSSEQLEQMGHTSREFTKINHSAKTWINLLAKILHHQNVQLSK